MLLLPATMQVPRQFQFISKEAGEAATTAAHLTSMGRSAPAVPDVPIDRPDRRPALARAGPFRCPTLLSQLSPLYTNAGAEILESAPGSASSRSRAPPPARPSPHVRARVPAEAARPAPSRSRTALRTARAASASDAPVVIRSSTRTTCPARRRRPQPGATASAPARLASRCRASSPAWSATPRRCRSAGSTEAGTPCRRSAPAAARAIRRAGSWPRARTARGADGTGTSSTAPWSPWAGPAGPPGGSIASRSPARTAPARASPSGRARARAPRSLWASSAARTSSAYRAAACVTGSPAGSGSGRTRRGAAPLSAVRHRAQSTARGLPHPPHSAGSTRSERSCHQPRMTPLCQGPPRPATPVENSTGRRALTPDRPARSLPSPFATAPPTAAGRSRPPSAPPAASVRRRTR